MKHLANTSSPYLLQHASNPVDWYPWGEEAFQRARVEEKPIFLSIGYSTCHWCHVMAHESFEDEKIAALLNQYFICIKVDREERPDVDRLYMTYVQALTGSGGWPMSVWLTPELKPFFGGTYFPPDDRYGRIGFPSVLLQLSQLWRENRGRLEQEAERAIKALQHLAERRQEHLVMKKEEILHHAYAAWVQSFDEKWGGFGGAPKFPRPSILLFLLRYAKTASAAESKQARAMVFLTLQKMAAGGLQDHLGGGFHRYSVDRIWQVPHFEKMLYDQAQLVMPYLEAAQVTGEKAFLQVARDTLDYVARDLMSPEGGFYAAEDADSVDCSGKKQEGAFYVWALSELEQLLSSEEVAFISDHYHLKPSGNIPEEYDPHEELVGKNILMLWGTACDADLEPLKKIKEKLFAARLKRSRPHRDEKIVTAWNGLMISAFAKAGAQLKNQYDVETAQRAVMFIKKHLYDPKQGTLLRSWYQGRSMEQGFAEDYAFLIQGLLDLYEATSDGACLTWAEELQEKMNELFWDHEQGGYFSSAAADPHLLVRLKEDYDGAEPAASSVAASNLLRFSKLSSGRFTNAAEMAERIFQTMTATLTSMPTAVPQLLVGLCDSLRSSSEERICKDGSCNVR
ncbi:MAG: thioredoxin domain-containing protein [Chthoniobacterales bacterium]|nr:thioredoxin domain-containing protein [Chthoniobacterales bacterium]